MDTEENNNIEKHSCLLLNGISVTIRNLNLAETLINVTTNYMDMEENNNIAKHSYLLLNGISVTIRNLNMLAT
jgi:hypothetical protein